MSKAVKRGKAWRIQVYDYTDEQGKKHLKSFTAPTKAEVEFMAAEFRRDRAVRSVSPTEMTVGNAVDRYIALKPMLSPTTLSGYKRMREFGFQELMDTPVSILDDLMMQEAVNIESVRISERTGKVISVKTLKDEYGLISAALKTVCRRTFIVTMPKKHKHQKEYPDPRAVAQWLKGTPIELPCMLALQLTFRMSEVRGLRCSDYNGKAIAINRVMVDTKNETVVKDNAKVEASLRVRDLTDKPYLRHLIESAPAYQHYLETGEDGWLIGCDRDRIYKNWRELARTYGYELSFHDLRHLAVMGMVQAGIPELYSMSFGGWADSKTMHDTYEHIYDEARKEYEKAIGDWWESALSEKS